eukprot:TRINITY_DN867_c0_g1_i1.p1 TRINITY_DN867_c0_g1~~TRINITY_DN867_c0_g1_i1.p1  ORF type:complete len:202 (-),score=28.49 TRINITY_DN867_c0_g1_i1:174-779(-)
MSVHAERGWIDLDASPSLKKIKPFRDLLLGKIGKNSNPFHPYIVHAPIVLLPLSFCLDFFAYLPFVHWFTGLSSSSFHIGAYFLCLLGSLFATAGVLTGLAEFSTIPLHSPNWKPTAIHACINLCGFLVALANCLGRRSLPYHTPSKTMLLMNFMTLFAMFYSAHVGEKLVYKYSTGVKRVEKQGKALKKKAKDEYGKATN